MVKSSHIFILNDWVGTHGQVYKYHIVQAYLFIQLLSLILPVAVYTLAVQPEQDCFMQGEKRAIYL